MGYEFEPACRRMEWLDPFYKAVWERAFADAIPISGTFELTPRCNFNCRMCYVHLQPEKSPGMAGNFPQANGCGLQRRRRRPGRPGCVLQAASR